MIGFRRTLTELSSGPYPTKCSPVTRKVMSFMGKKSHVHRHTTEKVASGSIIAVMREFLVS